MTGQTLKPDKPRLFIGSSLEGAEIAEAVRDKLDRDFECTVWTDGIFNLSGFTLNDLIKISKTKDFGVFVFSAGDIRGDLFKSPRDNVVFEFGLYIGEIGFDR
jgi:predicted nucleotide-binding protein